MPGVYIHYPHLCVLQFSHLLSRVRSGLNWWNSKKLESALQVWDSAIAINFRDRKNSEFPVTCWSGPGPREAGGWNFFGSSIQKLPMWPHSFCQQIRKRREKASFQKLMIKMKTRSQGHKPWVRSLDPWNKSCMSVFYCNFNRVLTIHFTFVLWNLPFVSYTTVPW